MPIEKLKDLADGLETISDDVRTSFSHLSSQQLNWKPSPEQWSVGQCFDHLVAANEGMLSQIDLKITGLAKPTVFERLPLLPKLFGRLVVNAVSPETTRKTKNPAIFDPGQSKISPDVIEKFLALQEKVAAAMTACDRIDVARTMMTSPVAKFVVYSLLDGYRIIVYHEKRHLQQAKRVMETNGFPRESIPLP
jgi:hypothetical protein